jgi:hypothetical protein
MSRYLNLVCDLEEINADLEDGKITQEQAEDLYQQWEEGMDEING